MFGHITNWKLMSGSHEFPGPDGGTCINEAAIVAAGFEYKKISSARDCPPCFSRAIAAYAIKLNDSMPDDLRNELLMPFVTRLSGTADTPEIERARVTYMAIQTVNRILPIVCRGRMKREDLASSCEAATTLNECREAARRVRAYAYAAAYAAAAAARRRIYTIATEILDGAIKLGNQAPAEDTAVIVKRLEDAKQKIAA
jgi:hypothetical protein